MQSRYGKFRIGDIANPIGGYSFCHDSPDRFPSPRWGLTLADDGEKVKRKTRRHPRNHFSNSAFLKRRTLQFSFTTRCKLSSKPDADSARISIATSTFVPARDVK